MEASEGDEITLAEALEVQEMLENQSVALLGASDSQNCSYAKGYMKRQALYACLTCNPKGAPFSQPGGVCLACSYQCHEGHEMVELFTKRNFRCDCGNKKFPDNPCRLQAEKDEVNSENVYNQNFTGMYCSCHRPYPDPNPDSEVADDPMIQCIICEDWYHTQHSLKYLNIDYETIADEYELICGPCMSRLDFLGHYSELVLKPVKVDGEQGEVDKDKDQTDAESSEGSSSKELQNETEEKESKGSDTDSTKGPDNSSNTSGCRLLETAKEILPFSDVNAIAWKGTLRSKLCRCTTCVSMYKTLKIDYLLDEEDTFEHYEAVGKKKEEAAQLSAETSINNQINQLGRVGQLELMHGINHFKEQLAEFLNGHAANGTVVQREDVNNFFMKVREEQVAKRRRLE